MPKALIAVFSQSGNTRAAAETVGKILAESGIESEYYSIDKNNRPLPENWDYFILGTPLFYQIEPLIVRNFLENLPVFRDRKGFVFTTYADSKNKNPDSRMVANISTLLARKGIRLNGASGMICKDSSDIMKRTRDHHDRPYLEDREQFETKILELCRNLAFGQETSYLPVRKHLYAKNFVTFNIVPEMRVVHRDCSRCGVCVRVCPMNNIKLDGKIQIGKACMKCSVCENSCPNQAIRPDWRLLEWIFKLQPKYGKI